MGVVYEAEDLRLARRVAVKVLPPQGFGADQKVRIQRFEQEARAASLLNMSGAATLAAEQFVCDKSGRQLREDA
jgi:hypothetical protein